MGNSGDRIRGTVYSFVDLGSVEALPTKEAKSQDEKMVYCPRFSRFLSHFFDGVDGQLDAHSSAADW